MFSYFHLRWGKKKSMLLKDAHKIISRRTFFLLLATRIFPAASERTVTEKTYMFILLI